MAKITWQSKPDKDEWGPDTYWTCTQWIEWHVALKLHYGWRMAKIIFESSAAEEDSTGHFWVTCMTDNSFREYLKSESLSLSNITTKSIDVANKVEQGAEKLTGSVTDATTGLFGGLEDSFKGIGKTIGSMKFIIPAIIVVVLIVVIIIALKTDTNKLASAALKVA